MESWPLLALFLAMGAAAGVEAWRDKTPRKPFVWARPELAWWARKVTQRERVRATVVMPGERP